MFGDSDGLGPLAIGIEPELDKDDAVLDDGADGAEEEGEGVEEVFLLLGVGEEADSVRQVAGEREHEE